MTKIVFVDTETTSLRPDRRAWDVALIVREPGQPDVEHQWFVYAGNLDLANADPKSLQIGRFYERHPEFQPDVHPADIDDVSEHLVMHEVDHLTRGAHLVGSVPSFDAEVLATRMRANGILPGWHHHLIDVGTLAFGHYVAAGRFPRLEDNACDALPWSTTHLASLLGVPIPGDQDLHTAIGDARFARDLFDAITLPAGHQAKATL